MFCIMSRSEALFLAWSAVGCSPLFTFVLSGCCAVTKASDPATVTVVSNRTKGLCHMLAKRSTRGAKEGYLTLRGTPTAGMVTRHTGGWEKAENPSEYVLQRKLY